MLFVIDVTPAFPYSIFISIGVKIYIFIQLLEYASYY